MRMRLAEQVYPGVHTYRCAAGTRAEDCEDCASLAVLSQGWVGSSDGMGGPNGGGYEQRVRVRSFGAFQAVARGLT
jgi:hypothetical protein